MFDKRLLVTVASLLLVCAVAAGAALFPGRGAAPPVVPHMPAAEASRPRTLPPQPLPPRELDYLYVIREYEGRIAVFGKGSDVPEMVLETFVRHLPIYDRIQLREGVKVHSAQELHARIEDYTS